MLSFYVKLQQKLASKTLGSETYHRSLSLTFVHDELVEYCNSLKSYFVFKMLSHSFIFTKCAYFRIGQCLVWQFRGQIFKQNLRERLEEERAAVDALAAMCRKIRLETIEEIELLWSTMMSQQRYNTLLLFTTDMECILERRIDVLTRVIY